MGGAGPLMAADDVSSETEAVSLLMAMDDERVWSPDVLSAGPCGTDADGKRSASLALLTRRSSPVEVERRLRSGREGAAAVSRKERCSVPFIQP